MTAQPKRHHHVARNFQLRFADERGLLHAYNKGIPDKGVFATNPANLFVQKDLYTVRNKDGTRNTSLENWYSQLEGAVAPLLDHIEAHCLGGHRPGLPPDAKELWDTFFYHQQKRAPDIFTRLGLENDFYTDLPRHIADYERARGPLTEADKRELQSPAALERMLEFAKVKARSLPGEDVMDFLATKGLAFAIAPPNKAFILGDHPQARRGGSDLRDGNVELWMPIASRVAITPWGPPGTETLVRASADNVRVTNEVIYSQSNVVAARSPKLIASLAGLGF